MFSRARQEASIIDASYLQTPQEEIDMSSLSSSTSDVYTHTPLLMCIILLLHFPGHTLFPRLTIPFHRPYTYYAANQRSHAYSREEPSIAYGLDEGS